MVIFLSKKVTMETVSFITRVLPMSMKPFKDLSRIRKPQNINLVRKKCPYEARINKTNKRL